MKNNNTKPTPMNIDADEVEGFLTMKPSEITVHEGRFRPLDKDVVSVIAESIQQNGQLQPILITPNGDLIDGNHRLHACIKLKINVVANVVQEMDLDKLALIEIDTNLCRKELTKTEMENHLAKRKEIYNTLYPDTAKRGAKSTSASGKESFGADTAKVLGVSEKSIERMVKRGELASSELQEARDSKEITTGEMDTIITETGEDKEAQANKMKELIKKKADKKEAKVKEVPEEPPFDTESEDTACEIVQDDTMINLVSEVQQLKEQLKEVEGKLVSKEVALTKANQTVKNLKARIVKAKETNPDIKI